MVVKSEDEGDDIEEKSEVVTDARVDIDRSSTNFGPCDIVVFLPKFNTVRNYDLLLHVDYIFREGVKKRTPY